MFCRFIDTADYVAEHLDRALGNGRRRSPPSPATLPPAERERAHRATSPPAEGRHVLVATDCLSEGVNLQDAFQAVVHYDLAWNPTRHEQREGRVDRFGQRRHRAGRRPSTAPTTRSTASCSTCCIRKHQAIRKATGVVVPVPDTVDSVVEALLEGLLLRGQDAEQLTLDLGLDRARRRAAPRLGDRAAEKEKASRTKYAQRGIQPDEVAAEVADVRAPPSGTHGDVDDFARTSAARPAAPRSRPTADGFTRPPRTTLPLGAARRAAAGHATRCRSTAELPLPRGDALLARTDPTVEAVARYVLDAALDPRSARRPRPARRCGVMRTTRRDDPHHAAARARYRFHLDLPGRAGIRQLVAEDARLLAFARLAATPHWLDDERGRARCCTRRPDAQRRRPTRRAQHRRRALDGSPARRRTSPTHAPTSSPPRCSTRHRRVRARRRRRPRAA